jgi:hypothetical protein
MANTHNGKVVTGNFGYKPTASIRDMLSPGNKICLFSANDDSGKDYRIAERDGDLLLLVPEEAAFDNDCRIVSLHSNVDFIMPLGR